MRKEKEKKCKITANPIVLSSGGRSLSQRPGTQPALALRLHPAAPPGGSRSRLSVEHLSAATGASYDTQASAQSAAAGGAEQALLRNHDSSAKCTDKMQLVLPFTHVADLAELLVAKVVQIGWGPSGIVGVCRPGGNLSA